MSEIRMKGNVAVWNFGTWSFGFVCNLVLWSLVLRRAGRRLVSAGFFGCVQVLALVLRGRVIHDSALGIENAFGEVVGIVSSAEHLFEGDFLFLPQLEE